MRTKFEDVSGGQQFIRFLNTLLFKAILFNIEIRITATRYSSEKLINKKKRKLNRDHDEKTLCMYCRCKENRFDKKI